MKISYQQTLNDQKQNLKAIADEAQAEFAQIHKTRETALRLSRQIIRNSANSIRAAHRGDFVTAHQLLDTVSDKLQDIEPILKSHPSVYYAGFVEDAQKEYVEANTTLAFVQGKPLPGPDELKVGFAPYLNGLAESVGELRRFILDSLRQNESLRCEEILDTMDEVYAVLTSMDFPETVTRGLRRSTDMVRGILERTRGDLTVADRQRQLEQKLTAFQDSLDKSDNGEH